MNELRSLVAFAALAAACSATVDGAYRTPLHGDDAGGATTADSGATPPADLGSVTPTDAGTTADVVVAPVDVPPRFDPNAACITGRTWTGGNRQRQLMNPGRACRECHTREREATNVSIGGTVYYAPHEQDLCYGYTGDPPGSNMGTVTVRVVDANGTELRMVVNATGNFHTTRALRFPLSVAEVIGPTGNIVAMGSEVPHGDCNLCHTRMGTTTPTGDAPGRITVPF